MKKILILLGLIILTITSCKTPKNVIYFQDLQEEGMIETTAPKALTFRSGDRICIIVNSSMTPEIASRFNLPIVTVQAGLGQSIQNQLTFYTVDSDGYIEVPSLGKVRAEGLTRSQLSQNIQDAIRQSNQLNDAIVSVTTFDRYVTVLGEVKVPGRIPFTKDHMTILEAIGAAGDLNIMGRRDHILVVREENGQTRNYFVDLRDSKTIYNSPVYYLQQNDMIYVEPNKVRTGQSTINDNSFRSVASWLSMTSALISICILIFK